LEKLSSSLRKRLLGIDPREVEFARRGFSTNDPAVVERLERAGRFFVRGYLLALDDPEPSALAAGLDEIEGEFRGFAYEGAGMALALLDLVAPWRRDRLGRFLAGPGDAHVYMVLIGAGWAWARLRRRPDRLLRGHDPTLGWLALDGYGFHEAYFHTTRTVDRQQRPRRLHGYALRAFDTGVGRALWFVCCAEPSAVTECIAAFEPSRQLDIWSGTGLACAYAGGVDDDQIAELQRGAGPQRAALAQGAAFAAKAQLRAGTPAEHTRRAVERLCNTSLESAAELCDSALRAVPDNAAHDGDEPGFDLWRRSIREQLEQGLDGALIFTDSGLRASAGAQHG
jgi:hypothetical protein